MAGIPVVEIKARRKYRRISTYGSLKKGGVYFSMYK
jgi:hypothetical protein